MFLIDRTSGTPKIPSNGEEALSERRTRTSSSSKRALAANNEQSSDRAASVPEPELTLPNRNHWPHRFSPDSPFGVLERKKPGSIDRMLRMRSRELLQLTTELEENGSSNQSKKPNNGDMHTHPGKRSNASLRHLSSKDVPDALLERIDDETRADPTLIAQIDRDLDALDNDGNTSAPSTIRHRDPDERDIRASLPNRSTSITGTTELRELLSNELIKGSHGALKKTQLGSLTFGSFDRQRERVVLHRQTYAVSPRGFELRGKLIKACDDEGIPNGSDDPLFPRAAIPRKPDFELVTSSGVWARLARAAITSNDSSCEEASTDESDKTPPEAASETAA